MDNWVSVPTYPSFTNLERLGNNDDQNKPVLLMKDDQIKQICCGCFHSLIYKKNGELLVFCRHDDGQLGLGNKKNGELWSFGHNCLGQLGQLALGNKEDINKPVLLCRDPSIKFIMDKNVELIWNPDNHTYYPKQFKDKIYYLILFLKRNQIQTGLKIPKFVIFEIIKLID